MPVDYRLPTGRRVAVLNAFEADLLVKEIFTDGVYDGGGLVYRDGDTYLDLGGNIGLFAHYAATRANELTIYSCEPVPALCRLLRDNTALLEGVVVHAIEVGVAAQIGTLTFDYKPRFACASSAFPDRSADRGEKDLQFTLDLLRQLKNPVLRTMVGCLPNPVRRLIAKAAIVANNQSEPVECRVTTISQLIRDHDLQRIDLLKMDIEGAEVEALRGIEPDHWGRIKQLCVETHFGDELHHAVHRRLTQHGYTVTERNNPVAPDDRLLYAIRS